MYRCWQGGGEGEELNCLKKQQELGVVPMQLGQGVEGGKVQVWG